jgi:hypothetical protein
VVLLEKDEENNFGPNGGRRVNCKKDVEKVKIVGLVSRSLSSSSRKRQKSLLDRKQSQKTELEGREDKFDIS